jgi:hypothetical protein
MSLSAYQTKEVEVGGEIYNLKKFKALIGLAVQKEIHEAGLFTDEGINVMALTPEQILKIISNGCSKGSIAFDQKTFDNHFAGKYMEIYHLVAEVLMYNFADPNAEAATEE